MRRYIQPLSIFLIFLQILLLQLIQTYRVYDSINQTYQTTINAYCYFDSEEWFFRIPIQSVILLFYDWFIQCIKRLDLQRKYRRTWLAGIALLSIFALLFMIFGFNANINVIITTILETLHQCEIIEMLLKLDKNSKETNRKIANQEEVQNTFNDDNTIQNNNKDIQKTYESTWITWLKIVIAFSILIQTGSPSYLCGIIGQMLIDATLMCFLLSICYVVFLVITRILIYRYNQVEQDDQNNKDDEYYQTLIIFVSCKKDNQNTTKNDDNINHNQFMKLLRGLAMFILVYLNTNSPSIKVQYFSFSLILSQFIVILLFYGFFAFMQHHSEAKDIFHIFVSITIICNVLNYILDNPIFILFWSQIRFSLNSIVAGASFFFPIIIPQYLSEHDRSQLKMSNDFRICLGFFMISFFIQAYQYFPFNTYSGIEQFTTFYRDMQQTHTFNLIMIIFTVISITIGYLYGYAINKWYLPQNQIDYFQINQLPSQ